MKFLLSTTLLSIFIYLTSSDTCEYVDGIADSSRIPVQNVAWTDPLGTNPIIGLCHSWMDEGVEGSMKYGCFGDKLSMMKYENKDCSDPALLTENIDEVSSIHCYERDGCTYTAPDGSGWLGYAVIRVYDEIDNNECVPDTRNYYEFAVATFCINENGASYGVACSSTTGIEFKAWDSENCSGNEIAQVGVTDEQVTIYEASGCVDGVAYKVVECADHSTTLYPFLSLLMSIFIIFLCL
eukprot:121302_1